MKEKSEGLTAAQKKLPSALQAAILKKKGGKKHIDTDDEGLDHPNKKEKSEGLTAAQKKLPPALQAAILKKKGGKKHMDADEGLDHPKKADLNKDGKLSSYEKKRAKAIEDSMRDKKESHWAGSSLSTFNEWLKWRNNINEAREEGEEFEDEMSPGGRSASAAVFAKLQQEVAQLKERVKELERLLAESKEREENWSSGHWYR